MRFVLLLRPPVEIEVDACFMSLRKGTFLFPFLPTGHHTLLLNHGTFVHRVRDLLLAQKFNAMDGDDVEESLFVLIGRRNKKKKSPVVVDSRRFCVYRFSMNNATGYEMFC